MEVVFRYGQVQEVVTIPDGNLLGVARSPVQVKGVSDAAAEIKRALASPMGTPLLRELACGCRKVAILISDHTRPTPSRLLLPYLLEELEAGGIRAEGVTVVVATGLHEPPDRATLERMLGSDLLARVRVVVHDPDDEANLVDLGTTSRGTPLRVNRAVAEADLVSSVSTVEPHLLYGWSGGAKNVIPGVSSRQTVYVHHGRHRTDPGGLDKVENNVFREDAEEAGRMVGLRFILNVLLNEKRELIGAYAGDPVVAHRAAVAAARKLNVVYVPQLADIVVCALGGSPRDADFWQAQGKGLMHTGHMVRDGGVLILAAGCEMGVGAPAFKRLLQGSMEEIIRWHEEQDYSVPLMKAFDTVSFLRRARLYLVTPGLTSADLPRLPVRFFSTVTEALAAAMEEVGHDARVLAVPDSSRVVVCLSTC